MNRYVLLFGLIVLGFLAVGMFQAKSGAGESGDRIRELNAEIVQLRSEIELLEAEMDTLTGRARIAELASSRLGMGPARSRQMIDIEHADVYFGPLTEWENEE